MKTKLETLGAGLRTRVDRRNPHRELMKLRGKIHWEGDLDEMRRDRSFARGD